MRNTIIDVAGDLFADRGAENVSFDEIAATAGITARQLRAYFTSTTAIQAATEVRDGAEHELGEGGSVGAGTQLVA